MPTVRQFRITINGKVYEVKAEELTEGATDPREISKTAVRSPEPIVAAPPSISGAQRLSAEPRSSAGEGTAVDAPLPGLVLDVKVAAGQSVKEGDVLVILEAMKMENEIVAPHDGTIAEVPVSKGVSVSVGDTLVVLK